MTSPSVPSDIRALYTPTGKSGRLADVGEAGRLAAAIVTAALVSLDLSLDPRPVVSTVESETCGYRPDSLAKWREPVLTELARSLGCHVRRESGRVLTIYGDPRLADVARWLGGQLFDALDDYSNRQYLSTFYHLRGLGRVEEARGERGRIMDSVLSSLRRSLTDSASARGPELTAWMSRHSVEAFRLLPGDKTVKARGPRDGAQKEAAQKEAARKERLEAIVQRAERPTAIALKRMPDEDLEAQYGRVLASAHGIKAGGPPNGVAFSTDRNFSVSAAVMSATERLGTEPTHYRFWQGYLYLSAPHTGSSSVLAGRLLANAQYSGVPHLVATTAGAPSDG